ncbi:hypothetical protein SAMN05216241_10652 [Limimonas halophila]|uniref:Uncharacterized protein n=1 Tax=Limimonas halophila TaxID=1082479 RepID=A0A1G7RYQ1_9PROT|nr:Thivi_2564 family membrane protein [Limimonas halophila]SDG15886.1 hypothetical protein SAMN05216241_10652 [Limimonas halophila]
MPIIPIVVTLVIAGVVLWLINAYIPMDNRIRGLLNLVVVIVVIVWLLSALGVIGGLQAAPAAIMPFTG